ncbi:MAG: N-acetyltransferase, partial [Chitinophagaceae bacterium]
STAILPSIKWPQGLRIEECTNTSLLAWIGSNTEEDVVKRLANDHLAFVAYMNNIPAAFGWMARGKATIGELGHELVLPIGNRYLWNFRTMEAFRGLGIYPALLHYIIDSEKRASRFWIIHAPENNSSLRGIKKAGFEPVGKLYSNDGVTTIENTPASQKACRLLSEMNIAISTDEPASCWNCSSPYLKKRKAECCCLSSQDECVGNNLLALAS